MPCCSRVRSWSGLDVIRRQSRRTRGSWRSIRITASPGFASTSSFGSSRCVVDLEPGPLSRRDRLLLLAVIGFGLLSVLYFAEFWFFSEARRRPVYFALLSFAIFWGVHRSLFNWYTYFFITPPRRRIATRYYGVDVLTT